MLPKRSQAGRVQQSQEVTAAPPATGFLRPPTEPRPPIFVGADGKADKDFERIVDAVFAVDIYGDYEDLEKNLEVGEGRSDYATLRFHLDKAEERARRAHRLYLGSKVEYARWEADAKKVAAAMRQKATEALEAEKTAGERTKNITNVDVDAMIRELYADEVEAQALRKVKMEGVVSSLENLAWRWNSKCEDLRTLLETLRR